MNSSKYVLIAVSLLLAFLCIFIYSDNKNLNAIINEQAEMLNVQAEQLDDAANTIEKLENQLVTLQSDYSVVQFRLRKAHENIDELESAKIIPVYHCNHSESSAISLIHSFLDNMPWELDEYGCEDGYIVSGGLADDYANWCNSFADETGYWDYFEYELYFGD